MPNYRLTPVAKSDLLEIWNYTVETCGVKQAEKYLVNIEIKLEQLADNPKLGRQRPEIRPGYYSFPVGKHIIFYLHSGKHVDIIGVLHGRMDVDKNLFPSSSVCHSFIGFEQIEHLGQTVIEHESEQNFKPSSFSCHCCMGD